MSSHNKLQLFRHLLYYTPPLIKFIVTDGNNNASICVVLNNEIFMDSSHPNISLDAVNEACSALSIALDTYAVIIEKKCNESDILMDWHDFKSELDAYIDDCLVNDGAMPVEFEYNYEDLVFDFDEYQHFINLDESKRHMLKIADHEGEHTSLFAELYQKEVSNLAVCLNTQSDTIKNDDITCHTLLLRSDTLKKMMVMAITRKQSQLSTDSKSTLHYITMSNDWTFLQSNLTDLMKDIKHDGYTLSCDPTSLMQADDIEIHIDITSTVNDFPSLIESFTLRTFKVINDDEKPELPITLQK